ncbi:hypothetical protein BJV77DRAFT_777652 [Russula vinacea]|nr:hypothetical protein BJV77DRAFT_777652 [Russula vinacea]
MLALTSNDTVNQLKFIYGRQILRLYLACSSTRRMSTPVCQTVSANSDVLGKGIRINFYYTMFLLAIVPQTPETEELLTSLYITAGTSGFGLLLTAIIQTAQHQLSLFHAIFILHILFFLGTGVLPMGRYHWTTSRAAIGFYYSYSLSSRSSRGDSTYGST